MKSVSRLTRAFAPDHYDLSIKLDRLGRSFDGVVTINGRVPTDSKEVRLHSKDLDVKSITFDGKSAAFSYDENDELVINHPDITKGKHIIVVSFSGKITDDMNGIYPCYFNVEGQKQELLATQFESHYARRAFPCVDEPEAKATFDVTLSTEKDVTVLGNMPVLSQVLEKGQLITKFETTPRMSSYLVAWVVGKLQKKTAVTKRGVEVSVWSTEEHDLSDLDFALDIATRAIDFFEEYFGVPYPLPKSDHVALPDFSSGAMENWGLITYREIALLTNSKTTSLSTKHSVATVIAHELSHQWFGNLVTMEWWNDLWLNESFANLMEYIAVDALEPAWNIWLDYATSEIISALRRDSLDGVQAIQADVTHPDEISTIFDPSIVYAKGGRLLRMLQSYVGDKDMKEGLFRYFEKHQYSNTKADDLWIAIGGASGKDIPELMHSWMSQPGFPIVSATKNGHTVYLSQRQFFIGAHTDVNRVWTIPLAGLSSQIPERLSSKDLSFNYTDNLPLFLNSAGASHFITHYDSQLLDDIVKNIDILSPVDKLSFLHEQTLLAKAGVQSTAELIPLLDKFKDDTSESVWSIVALTVNELKRFVEDDEIAEKGLKRLTGKIIDSQYKRLGWIAVENEPENDTKLRSTIISLALYAENRDATNKAAELFRSSNIIDLDSELRTAVMASAVRQAVPGAVELLIQHYRTSTSSELRDDIAAALTSTKDADVILRLLKMLKDSTLIRPQDFAHWFVWLMRNRYGRSLTWVWARQNWNWITKTFKGDSSYDMFPRYIAGSLSSKQHLDEFVEFFLQHRSDKALARNIKIGETELQGIVELLENDGPKVRRALS